jgi:hypothetical protein
MVLNIPSIRQFDQFIKLAPDLYLEDRKADGEPTNVYYQLSKHASQSFPSSQSLTEGLDLIMRVDVNFHPFGVCYSWHWSRIPCSATEAQCRFFIRSYELLSRLDCPEYHRGIPIARYVEQNSYK